MRLAIFTAALSVSLVGLSGTFARPAAAQQSPVRKLCISSFPSANQKTTGHTTRYNRQASVQAVSCNGFGFDPKFQVDGGIVCSVLSAAIGSKYQKLALFIDGSCARATLAAQHDVGTVSGVACGMLSDLLSAAPWARAYAAAAGVACSFGGPLGSWIESKSEQHAAKGVIRAGKCLAFTTHRFPLTDTWAAVRCARGDRGFSGLTRVRRRAMRRNVAIHEFVLSPRRCLHCAADVAPGAIAAGLNGDIWFTETGANQIGSINQAGLIGQFPLPEAVRAPGGITLGADGKMWFTAETGPAYEGEIGRLAPPGQLTEFLTPTAESGPDAIVRGSDGNLWFTEEAGASTLAATRKKLGKIGRITPSGQITEFAIPPVGSLPAAIAAAPDGSIWFTEYGANKIARIDAHGSIKELHIPTRDSEPGGIAVAHDGRVWFTEKSGNKIGRVSATGSIKEFPVPTRDSEPLGIAAGSDGSIWFTEYGADKVGEVSSHGSMKEFRVPTPNSWPAGIAVSATGEVWFTESNGDRIGRITTG
jgi:streptogramin lyase